MPTENPNIQIKRSDGKSHELHSGIFASALSGLSLASKDEVTVVPKKGTDHDHDHAHIKVKRSDGAAHDINEMMKAHTEREEYNKGGRLSVSDQSGTSSLSQLESHFPSNVRIVHMSDTHNFLMKNVESCVLPPGNILVHTGDFTNGGLAEEFEQFNQWLGSVTHIYHYRIICLGSRDVKVFQANWEKMSGMLKNATHVLCHSEATVLGIRFYGLPWNWQHLSNLNNRPGAPSNTNGGYQDIPDGVDCVISHVAAYDRLDSSGANLQEHWGSKELAEILRRKRVGLHLHGHIKDCRGVLPNFGNAPLTLNSCMSNRAITVLYGAPQVVLATNQRNIVGTPANVSAAAAYVGSSKNPVFSVTGSGKSSTAAASISASSSSSTASLLSSAALTTASVMWTFDLDWLIPREEQQQQSRSLSSAYN
jgi:hypothetical protein